jgi:hypothetical protein
MTSSGTMITAVMSTGHIGSASLFVIREPGAHHPD